jgi:hypothetical protein
MKSPLNQKLRLTGAFLALATLALGISCRGFFVNPTVTSLAVGPQNLSMQPTTTQQMTATATFDDGSTGNVNGQAVWSSSSPTVASFNGSSGLLTAASLADLQSAGTLPGTTTVTASDGSVTSSGIIVTVCPVVQSMVLKVDNGTQATITSGAALTFDATATFNGITGTTDVTDLVTWNISNTTILPNIDTTGNGQTTADSPGTFTVSASLCGSTSPTVTITAD